MTSRAALVVVASALGPLLGAQPLKQQARDGAPLRPMSAAELGALGDPFFRLLLRTTSTEARLSEVVRVLKGASGREALFVVHEGIVDPAVGQMRRGVVAFQGANQGIVLSPNVMLSFLFDSNGVTPGFIEAWGWDDARSRYNYYRLDGGGGRSTWKFRGTSVGADKLTAAERDGTCMACHVNGGPVMKELPFPWNNWHSPRSPADYLTSSGAGHWPIAGQPVLASLATAETMEKEFVLPSLRQFNGRRLKGLVRANAAGAPTVFAGGRQEITDGPRALRPLFETTEYNLASSSELSGLHPLASVGPGPAAPVAVPDTFFLNANLLAGGGVTQYTGLGIPEARSFASVLAIQPAEYRQLVSDAGTKLGSAGGDSNFAWFVPEASHIDNHLVDALVRRGVITPQFAAAVLAVDLETPVFSSRRASLLRFVPATFRFKPRAADDVPPAHPDALTTAVVASLQAAAPAAGSAEEDLLGLLRDPDPVEVLRQRVRAYLDRERTALAAAASRPAEMSRLFGLVIERRRAALGHPVLKKLVESPILFAMP